MTHAIWFLLCHFPLLCSLYLSTLAIKQTVEVIVQKWMARVQSWKCNYLFHCQIDLQEQHHWDYSRELPAFILFWFGKYISSFFFPFPFPFPFSSLFLFLLSFPLPFFSTLSWDLITFVSEMGYISHVLLETNYSPSNVVIESSGRYLFSLVLYIFPSTEATDKLSVLLQDKISNIVKHSNKRIDSFTFCYSVEVWRRIDKTGNGYKKSHLSSIHLYAVELPNKCLLVSE